MASTPQFINPHRDMWAGGAQCVFVCVCHRQVEMLGASNWANSKTWCPMESDDSTASHPRVRLYLLRMVERPNGAALPLRRAVYHEDRVPKTAACEFSADHGRRYMLLTLNYMGRMRISGVAFQEAGRDPLRPGTTTGPVGSTESSQG
jgi:hypothetical protein